jgi:two-component system response regulator YesN
MVSVLIVDDEKLTRDGLSTRMHWDENGFAPVGTAASAYEALARMEDSLPDIVVADIRMPDMDGIELLEIINNNYPSVRVVLISGYDEFEYAQAAISARAFCYILKPIDDNLLLSRAIEARDEILIERKQIAKDEQLKTRFEAWLPTVRNNYICRLIRDSASSSPGGFDDSEALGIDLAAKAYRVILLETQETIPARAAATRNRVYRDYAVLDQAIEMWDLDGEVHSFDCATHTGLLVVGHCDTERLRDTLSALRAWSNQRAGLTVTIGIGSEVKRVELLRESFVSADQALAGSIVAGRNAVIVADRLLPTESVHNATQVLDGLLRTMEPKVITAVRANNERGLADLAQAIADEIRTILERCVGAKNRLLHQVVGFLMKVRLAADLDVPKDGFLECLDVESIDRLQELLCEVFAQTVTDWQGKLNANNSYIVKRAIEYLHRNIKSDVSLTGVADALSLHPNYLSSIFRSEVGKRFVDYVREVKIDEAKRLLDGTAMRVYEVAAAVHYQDVNHFTRIFKQIVGCSPTEYRDLN